ncbi:hypothetical protein [Paracoccus sp. MC1862]|uniref:hypothetical protein n=1 Tax=Paracoccus sp. MC1862 TaxID=2760307 RepID=UPI0016018E34|nr:hypothetical protein [Paracoccus sp. MC1862]
MDTATLLSLRAAAPLSPLRLSASRELRRSLDSIAIMGVNNQLACLGRIQGRNAA